ncbi:MAG: 2-oxo acid dehydrogenase subunit E2 [Proteobacteria bacterium]|nr:2-oxo acid dehydrogenase subunit E2 [Pseudomonadota bacterium]
MAEFFLMPAATPTMTAGTIASWAKGEGDELAPADIVATVETDKAAMDIEVFDKTVLLKLLAAEGDDVPTGFPIAILGTKGEDISALLEQFETLKKEAAEAPPAAESVPTPAAEPVVLETAAPAPVVEATVGWTGPEWDGRPLHSSIMELGGQFVVEGPVVRASPVAKKMAKDRGIALTAITGSGPHGRIVKADVEAYRGGGSSAGRRSFTRGPDVPHRNSRMRKVIAQRLKESHLDNPFFFLTSTLECDRLVDFRSQLKEQGIKVSYNDLVVKAVALALREVPECNASWGDDAITRFGRVDVGVAVALPDGLITPVIRDADQKALADLSAETRELAGRARDMKLDATEYTNATFTVSNLGMMQIDQFTAILNPPAAGILAVGSLAQEPVVIDGELGIGWRMKVTMTCDHRVIDGALGARFLQAFRGFIEAPLAMVI